MIVIGNTYSNRWNNRQLEWHEGDYVQQDIDLKEFIKNNSITRIRYIVDSYNLKNVFGSENNDDPMLCVYIVKQKFKFSEIVKTCNLELKKLKFGNFLYLSINKFIAIPEPQENISNDYDQAIYEYISSRVESKIHTYTSGKEDFGDRFNWVHPLTRFYFIK